MIKLKKPYREDSAMAITVNIYYTGNRGAARKFAEEMTVSGVVDAIRAEAGNLRYAYFFPMEDPETVLLIDSWRDQQALDTHHASSMMAQIARLREQYDLHMRVERYLSDETPTTSQDEAFIRR
jgi:quinol monooxygenase YgiN